MPLTIRPAVPADAPTVVEFNRLLALETENKVLDPEVLARGVAAILGDPKRGWYFVADDKGRLAGQIGVTTEWSDWRNGWFWWIQSVYVRAEDRRRGVFRALFRHVEELARADSTVVGLRLYVERGNHPAQATYAHFNMRPIEFLILQKCPV
jgi:GNAT superfamily N-acetyltransferase